MRKKLEFSRNAIVPAVCFLLALIVGVAAIVEKILFNTEKSVYTTQYIFLGYLAFFFLFLAVVIPVMRWFFGFLKIRETNVFDAIATILVVCVSTIPMIVLVFLTLFFMAIFKKYIYNIYYWGISTAIILMGTITRHHGNIKTSNKKGGRRIAIFNHSAPWDYLGAAQAMWNEPWNIVAGSNLAKPKNPSFGDKLMAMSIGKVVAKYAIPVDRDSEASRVQSVRGILSEIQAGKNVAVFAEGTRTPKKAIMNGKILADFKDGAFRIAFRENIPIQPVVMDWPVIYRGKSDDRWGLRPCIIDIYFLDELYPENYGSFEELKMACWHAMNTQLASSQKVQKFLRT